MKIEVGKSYRTRAGEKASVVARAPDPFDAWPLKGTAGGRERSWTLGGRAGITPENDSFDDLVAEWPEQAWEWFGHALHFCGSSRCKSHLGTKVGPWIVSTIGDYFPNGPTRRPLNSPIGDEKPLYYETMVFPATGALGCGCPEHYGQEADGRRYATAKEATAGHMEMCRKWESVPEGGSPR